MKLLHQIGPRLNPNFNTLEEVLACREPMSFDGIYESVWNHREQLANACSAGQIRIDYLFACGHHLGKDNAFDVVNGQPLSRFCTLEQICELAEMFGARVGYHGALHLHCHMLTGDALRDELRPPTWIRWLNHNPRGGHFAAFAWPYGDFNDEAIAVAKGYGYQEAWSVGQGDINNRFALPRTHLNW